MAKKNVKHLKNIAYLVSRNKTKQEILKVIFPNGLEVGLPNGKFRNGAKVNGDMQIVGTLNAKDIRVDGVSLSNTNISFEPPVISMDATVGGRVPSPPATAFTKVFIDSTTTFTWAGHNAGRTVTLNNSYEIVSANITGICDNSSGTTLTATTSSLSGEGDVSYVVDLKNSSAATIMRFSVTKDGGDAKLLVTSVGEHATGTEDWTTAIVTVPIVTASGTSNKTFTVQKNLPGSAGDDGKNAVGAAITPSIIPVPTSVTGGTPNGLASLEVDGVGAAAGQTTDIYLNDIPSTAFVRADVFESVTPLIYDGFVAGSATYPDAGKFFIQGHQITASLDTGTAVSASCPAHPSNGTDDFNITGSIGSYPIFNLAVTDDGNNAKMALTFLSEHATSTTDYNSIKLDIPFAVKTAAGDAQNNIIRSFNIQKQLSPEDPTDGSDGSSGSDGADGVSVDLTRSLIPVDTDDTGGALDDGGDLADADISDQAFTKIDVNAGTTNVTFAGHNESGNPSSNTYKIVSDSMTAVTDNGTSLTESNSASEGDASYDVTFANSGTRLTIAVSSDSSDAKLKVSSLSEHEDGSSTDFKNIKVDVPIKVTSAAGTQTVTRTFTVQKIRQGAASPNVSLTPTLISIPTNANGAALADNDDLEDADITDQAFTKADVIAGTTDFTWGGAGLAAATYTTAGTYRHIHSNSTAFTDNGNELDDMSTSLGGGAGDTTYRVHFKKTGNSDIVLSFDVTSDSNDLKMKVRQLAAFEEDANSTTFDSVTVTVPIRVITTQGSVDVVRSFVVQKAKASATTISVPITIGNTGASTRAVGHKMTSQGLASPPQAGVFLNEFAINSSVDSNATYDSTLTHGGGQSAYNSTTFARVPAGETWSIKRLQGNMTVDSLASSHDFTMQFALIKTDQDDAGGTDQNFTEIANIDINGSSTINVSADGTASADTGAISHTVNAGQGLGIVMHINAVRTAGTCNLTGNLTLEYTK